MALLFPEQSEKKPNIHIQQFGEFSGEGTLESSPPYSLRGCHARSVVALVHNRVAIDRFDLIHAIRASAVKATCTLCSKSSRVSVSTQEMNNTPYD